jgi:hypothetical protein
MATAEMAAAHVPATAVATATMTDKGKKLAVGRALVDLRPP